LPAESDDPIFTLIAEHRGGNARRTSGCYKDDINDAAADFLAMIADTLRDPLPVSADSNLHPSPHQGGVRSSAIPSGGIYMIEFNAYIRNPPAPSIFVNNIGGVYRLDGGIIQVTFA
jgi:hypothetical protein